MYRMQYGNIIVLLNGVNKKSNMKKSEKITLILVALIPSIILLLGLTLSGISMTEFSLWFLILIPALLIIAPFVFFFAYRYAQRNVHDQPLEKRKKPLILVFTISTLVVAIAFVIEYYIVKPNYFWVSILPQAAFTIYIFFLYFSPFFRKKKEAAQDANQNKSEI